MKCRNFGNQTQSNPSPGLLRLSKNSDYGAIHDENQEKQLEPVNVKWLDGLGKEDGLLLPESHNRCPLNPCRKCIQPVLSVVSVCDGEKA